MLDTGVVDSHKYASALARLSSGRSDLSISFFNGAETRPLVDTNDTDISIIPSAAAHKNIVEETTDFDSQSISEPISARRTPPVFSTPTKSAPRSNLLNARSYQKSLENICVNDAKKYQHLLDGCNVGTILTKENSFCDGVLKLFLFRRCI